MKTKDKIELMPDINKIERERRRARIQQREKDEKEFSEIIDNFEIKGEIGGLCPKEYIETFKNGVKTGVKIMKEELKSKIIGVGK